MNNLQGFAYFGGETACTHINYFVTEPDTLQFSAFYELVVEGMPRTVLIKRRYTVHCMMYNVFRRSNDIHSFLFLSPLPSKTRSTYGRIVMQYGDGRLHVSSGILSARRWFNETNGVFFPFLF